MSGNMMKVTAVSLFQDKSYVIGPITKKVREMYWDWALSEKRQIKSYLLCIIYLHNFCDWSGL